MLNGIELARPDEWYSATADARGRFLAYVPVLGRPCVLPDYAELDCVMARETTNTVWTVSSRSFEKLEPVRIYHGPSGFMLGAGYTAEEAISDAVARLRGDNYERWLAIVSGWLECHPLSPRYRWAVGVATAL